MFFSAFKHLVFELVENLLLLFPSIVAVGKGTGNPVHFDFIGVRGIQPTLGRSSLLIGEVLSAQNYLNSPLSLFDVFELLALLSAHSSLVALLELRCFL